MLKIVKKASEESTSETSEKSWVLARTSPKDNWVSLELPFTVGFHQNNDVFINAPTMKPLSKIVLSKAGQIVSVDAATHEVHSVDELKLFGVEMMGPFTSEPSKLSYVSRLMHLFLSKEKSFYNKKVPKSLIKVLPQKQLPRIGLLTFIVLGTVFSLNSLSLSDPSNVDMSNTPIFAGSGDIVNIGIASSGVTHPYAKGAKISINIAEPDPKGQYVLTLGLGGLDLAEELSIKLNEVNVADTTASQNCVESVCLKEFPIQASSLLKGQNMLTVTHNSPSSPYVLKSVFLRKMEVASDEENELVKQLISSSERYYDERQLLIKNIKNAKDAIEEAERLLDTRIGLESNKPKFLVAKKKINEAFLATSQDLQFKLQKEMKLDHPKPAIAIIHDLLKLYPEPSSRQYMMLTTQLKKLQESIK